MPCRGLLCAQVKLLFANFKFRLVLLSPRSFNFELESEVNKELRLFRNIGAQSSGDYLTGLD